MVSVNVPIEYAPSGGYRRLFLSLENRYSIKNPLNTYFHYKIIQQNG